MAELPSQEYLKSRIDYNPETGEARWKPVDESFGPNWQRFNKQSASKILPNRAGVKGRVYSKNQLIKVLIGEAPTDRVRELVAKAKNYGKIKTYKPIDKTYQQLLIFDHKAGNLLWKARGVKDWDARFANKIAGSVGKSGYSELRTKLNGEYAHYMSHRVAWFLYYDVDPLNFQIDHIDGNRINNKVRNLRLATNSFNQQAKLRREKTFYKRERQNTFYASISVNGNCIYLGDYKTEAEARVAYEEAVAKYKPIYQFTLEEQTELDELYATYPNVTRELQHRCHALQVKALNHYIEGATQ